MCIVKQMNLKKFLKLLIVLYGIVSVLSSQAAEDNRINTRFLDDGFQPPLKRRRIEIVNMPFHEITPIKNWKKNEEGKVSLKHSLSRMFSESCNFDFLVMILQDDRVPEDILVPILSNLSEDRTLCFWKHIKSLGNNIRQEDVLIRLRKYWGEKEIEVEKILSAGFSMEDVCGGPFGRLIYDHPNPEDFLQALEENTTLVSLKLDVDFNRAQAASLGKALENGNLKLLEIRGGEEYPELKGSLSDNRTLISLYYGGGCNFKTAAILLNNPTFRHLELGGPYAWEENFIPEEGKEFTRALSQNHTLHSLFLTSFGVDEGYPEIPQTDKAREFEQNLLDALSSNVTLTSLQIEELFISDEGQSHLLEAIGKHKTLTSLHLSINCNTTQLRNLFEALKTNPTLTSFYIYEQHGFGDTAAQEFSDVLKVNKILSSLSLLGDYGNGGLKALVDGLIVNTSVTSLALSGHFWVNTGHNLANLLRMNTTITALNLYGNRIHDLDAEYIASALLPNTTLRTLGLSNNHIGDSGALNIAHALATNESLDKVSLTNNKINHPQVIERLAAFKERIDF